MHALAMSTHFPDDAPMPPAPDAEALGEHDALAAVREAFRIKLASALDKQLAPASAQKIGRNDPCRCGSGRKYKKCCLGNP